jgi:hypothetical protein
MMASSQSFSMIHLRMSLSPEPAPPVNSGEPLKTMARREPCLCCRRAHGLELVDHVLQEEQRAVVHARQPGAEAAVEAALVVLLLDLLLLLLPVHAEGRIGEEVVEGLARELVLGEAVAVADVVARAVVVHLLHQHVGGRGGEGALVVVLPVDVELGRAVVLAQVVLRLGQHAAGAAGRVEQLAHGAGRGEQLVVVDEQDAHHQPDDLARREVVARGLVGQFVEAPDEVLEDEPHLLVRHRVRVQVHVAELGDDEVEDVRLAHPLDLGSNSKKSKMSRTFFEKPLM